MPFMQDDTIKIIISSQCQLGEGAYFAKAHNCLFWVDIIGQQLFRLNWQTKRVSQFAMPEPICWLMETQQGQLIAGFEKAIYHLDSDTFARRLLFSLPNEPNSNRLNDAKTDRNGYGFFGSMNKQEQHAVGALYRFGQGQPPEQVDQHYTISNGPAVSCNGEYLYSTDSEKRTIYRFKLDPQGGLSAKQAFITFSDAMGFPDGMTVDSEDHLWVAAWNGFGVYRFSPAGRQVQFIRLPAPRVTSVAFVGEQLEHLAITTATVGLEQAVLDDYPHSGGVFILKPGVKGLPETPVIL
ncbi:SMP-30/gluconolactonase/LRE family protein [Pseudoalteromonas mariniglutinosa]|uniref:SMP-30/gluconolactonase/LRE family protein n=1 Tax=Pseudoalteromonas mariniglutinosa TaxID=206042 RepID=UPI00384BA7DF